MIFNDFKGTNLRIKEYNQYGVDLVSDNPEDLTAFATEMYKYQKLGLVGQVASNNEVANISCMKRNQATKIGKEWE